VAPDSSIAGPALFTRLRTFIEGAAMYSGDCRALEADQPGPDDLILIPYATEVELLGLARWLNRLHTLGQPRPFVVAVVHRPDYAWLWTPDTGELCGDLAPFAYACFSLLQACQEARLALMTTTQALASVLEQHVEMPFLAGCAPMHYPPQPDELAPLRWDFAFLGQMRPEKGSRSLAAIVRAYLQARPQARIAIQCDSPGDPAQYLDDYASIAGESRIDWLMGPQDDATFQRTLQEAGCILIPSDPARYKLRVSGIFSDALGNGRPVVVAGPSWMTEMLQAGHGAAVAVRNPTPEKFARALLTVQRALPEFQQRASERSVRWRKEQSMERLVDIIVQQIAAA